MFIYICRQFITKNVQPMNLVAWTVAVGSPLVFLGFVSIFDYYSIIYLMCSSRWKLARSYICYKACFLSAVHKQMAVFFLNIVGMF